MTKRNLLENKRVLIVDDEPDVLETLKDLLPMCRLSTATSFEAAKDLLEQKYFDIAILDIMGVDGYKLLEITTQRNIISIMLTAHAVSPDNVKRSFQEGATFYIPKEKMSQIEAYLLDILEDIEKGKNPWERWLDKLGSYYERHYGPEWDSEDKDFWTRFPFY